MVAVLQATAWYPPAHLGGTEIYLTGLVRELRAHGVVSRLIAPLAAGQPDTYEYDGATVRTYPVNPAPSRAELRGEVPHPGFARFCELLTEERPLVYHQHSWTRGLGLPHLRAARTAGIKTVLTVHTPDPICLRGTMVRFGREACDGLIDPPACAACRSHARGAPAALARALGAVPPRISRALGELLPDSRFATAVSARASAERRRLEFRQMTADADRIVAVCGWLFDALTRNGVPAEKLVLSRQGIDPDFAAAASRSAPDGLARRDRRFRLLYLGRWHAVKGVDVLVRAVRSLSPEVPVDLSIHGVGDGPEEQRYASGIRQLAAGDPRIAIQPAVPRAAVMATLARADALAVPSLCLETGPLVVLEAKAAGVLVIGSRLGGIAELVRDPEDGTLVTPGDAGAWARAIAAMAADRAHGDRSAPEGKIRTMRDAAADMAALYAAL